MSVEQYGVRQDCMFVAKVDVGEGPDGDARARAEADHYMMVYSQDGPVELWRRSRQRKWRPLYSVERAAQNRIPPDPQQG